jgi:DNA-binding MarR family transcriptional regulator
MANQFSSTASSTAIVDVADRLHSAAIHMLRYLRRADAATGLTAARASVLSVLVFGGPTTIGDLATAEQVSAPTMTKLITSLEGEGLVRRAADERDGRVVRVHATPSAARILRRGRAARVRVLAATLRSLDSAALATLGRAADILRTLEEQRRDRPAARRRKKR